MKHILAPLAVLLTASAAQAHNGLHMHPHGSESWLPVAVALAVMGVAAAAWKVSK